ncbi:MAG: hypothetical protein H7289_01110 [Mucilaginibacter sp.]|nr:hypothetical protein [Mucilaginibacter sp.]
MSVRSYFFILIGCAILSGCAQEQKKPANLASVPKAPVLIDPFKFHKMIEVAPGQYYDIFSWGRGAVDTGSLLILHSDSSGRKFTTTTGDLNGTIVDVYNSDMDIDGHPEILLQAKRKDTINYTTIYAFEFYESRVQKLDFPKLTNSQRKGYRGNDNFYISEGKFIREFTIYEGSGPSAKPTGAKRKLEYTLNSNSFNVKQLSKDSTSVKGKPLVSESVKKPVEEKHTTTKKSEKKKHHKAVIHKKKKKHHRR